MTVGGCEAVDDGASKPFAAAHAAMSDSERSGRQAGGEESEFHAGTSTQVEDSDEVITASTSAAARAPSANVGSPSGAGPSIAA